MWYNNIVEETPSSQKIIIQNQDIELTIPLEEYNNSSDKESKPFENFLDRTINDYNETIGKSDLDN